MNKILVVDEEYVIRMLYQEELMEEGYEVTTADNYDGLLNTIDENRPDLVVLDVKLDRSNILDLLQEIRNAFNDISIILSTANHFMIKSSDLSRLKHMVKLTMQAGEKSHGEGLELAISQDHVPTNILTATTNEGVSHGDEFQDCHS